jgi:hypothetical protein
MVQRQQQAKENLKKCIAECRPEEAKLAERMLAIVETVTDSKTKFEDQLPAMVSLYRDMIDLYEKENDVKDLVSTYSAALALTPTLKTFGVTDQAFVQKVNQGVEQLPIKYPNDAKVYGLLGFYLSVINAGQEPIIAAYKQCLILDAKNQACRKSYDLWVQIYTQARCLGSDLNAHNFGLYLGSAIKTSGLVEIKSNDEKIYYVEAHPKIEARDVDYVSSIKGEFDQPELNIHLTSDGQKRVGELTRSNIGKTLAIVLNDKVLSAPIIQGEINTDSIRVTSGAASKNEKPLFEQICERPTSPELPAGLKL